MSGTDDKLMTVSQAAQRLQAQTWWITRVYERGLLPEPLRLGRNRVLRESDLPALEQALRQAGYLPLREEGD